MRNIERLIASAALLLAGCAAFRKAPPPKAAAPAAEVAMNSGKGDTATSLDLGLSRLDSSQLPSAYASELYLLTLDNYLGLAGRDGAAQGADARVAEVLIWKGNHYYNKGEFEKSLEAYDQVIRKYPASAVAGEARQMSAQAFAQVGKFDEAEKLYRQLTSAKDTVLQSDAKERLAQAVYLQAEKAEKGGQLQTASERYASVAKEFPTVEIAPVALFNAGVMQEKQKKWKEAVRIYGLFFDAYYESKLLPKVLFREAKCRELDGQWEAAGDKYLNLVKANPQSPEAEPALYNAGFAFVNAKKPEAAARAFEAYALQYPQNAETPNLLFRAVEIYGELKNWEKVAELQTLFTRKYATDKGRLIQALCMGGTAAFQRNRWDEAAPLMERAIAEFAALKAPDPSSRFYAAQAQHTLGEIAAKRMHERALRAAAYDGDLKAKTAQLKAAVSEYLKVFDYRIVEWALRAAYSMGEAFEDFGSQVYAAPRKPFKNGAEQLDREEEALASLASAYEKAQQQYLQVVSISRKQEVNNRWVEEANVRLVAMALRLTAFQAKTMAWVPQVLRVDASTPEKAIAGKLQQINTIAPIHAQGAKYFQAFLDIAQEYELDPKAVDTLAGSILRGKLQLGGHYLSAAELARGLPLPSGFQPMERFFFKAKLLQEGIPKLEEQAMVFFQEGITFAEKYGLAKAPQVDSLRNALGRAMFLQAKCLDLLATEALINPPIPAGAGPELRKTYSEKLETLGYQLQDQAIERYRRLVEKVITGTVPGEWGEMAFARLYQIEPDKWTRTGEADTTVEYYSGRDWSALPALPGGKWPADSSSEWKKVRKGLMPARDFPPHVQQPFRFLWCGDKGLGPKVDTAVANYLPWKQVWAQIPLTLPDKIQSMELEVVAPWEWTVMVEGDTVLTHKALTGPWFKGAGRDILPLLSKPKGKAPGNLRRLRIWAQNQKPAEGFGIWIKLKLRYKFAANGPVFPWNQQAPAPDRLKQLLEREFDIPNFAVRKGRP